MRKIFTAIISALAANSFSTASVDSEYRWERRSSGNFWNGGENADCCAGGFDRRANVIHD